MFPRSDEVHIETSQRIPKVRFSKLVSRNFHLCFEKQLIGGCDGWQIVDFWSGGLCKRRGDKTRRGSSECHRSFVPQSRHGLPPSTISPSPQNGCYHMSATTCPGIALNTRYVHTTYRRDGDDTNFGRQKSSSDKPLYPRFCHFSFDFLWFYCHKVEKPPETGPSNTIVPRSGSHFISSMSGWCWGHRTADAPTLNWLTLFFATRHLKQEIKDLSRTKATVDMIH